MTRGTQVAAGLGSMIHSKTLKLSCTSHKAFTQGQVLNLLQADCAKAASVVNQLAMGISIVGTLAVAMCLLYWFLGAVSVVGVGICVVAVVINYFVAKVDSNYAERVMKLKNERIRKTNEALQSIKILKMYGWCDLFQSLIEGVREKEIYMMQKNFFISGLFITFLHLFPKLVSIGSFFLYAYISGHTTMGVIFASIDVFSITLRMFPQYVSKVVEAFISERRISEFLESEEVANENIEGKADSEHALEINGYDFIWSNCENTAPQDEDCTKKDVELLPLDAALTDTERGESTNEKSNSIILTHVLCLSLIHICRCRRIERCRSRWSPYH
eukprot:TRINITY_DN65_c0_g2_i1.p1 TRINITY_DN65_c0_g2~~TRINITY_DN65_c0_g2_i1.p1  ORF type:complete len:330 (-),score=63.15 TRINITY_DN65_c0_g2_i1:16-1005(-)